MRVSEGAKRMNVEIVGDPRHSDYVVKDVFTTIDGQWFVSGNPYSIPQWAIDEYGTPPNIDLGGAQHIFARIENKAGEAIVHPVIFGQRFPSNDDAETKLPDKKENWAEFPTWVVFYPNDGSPSSVWHKPNGSYVTLRGGGLPVGHHVSLFTVWRYDPDGTVDPDPDPDPDPDQPTTIALVDDAEIIIKTNGYNLDLKIR